MQNNKLIVAPVVFFACIIIGFTVYLVSRYSTYAVVNKERLDPLGFAHFETGLTRSKYDVSTFGDSRALAWGNFFASKGIETLNLGIANQTSAQARYRIDYQSENLELGVIIIQIGINDLKQVRSDNYETIVKNCKSNIDHIVRKAQSIAETVVVSTIFPLGEPPFWRKILLNGKVQQAIDEVNAHIVSMEGVEVYDAYHFLVGDHGYVKDIYFKDTLHLNERAYEEMDLLGFLQ